MTPARVKPAIERVTVVDNERVTDGVGLLTLRAPRCAARVLPGQFVHLRVGTATDVLLRRPFSVHRAYDDVIEILYQVLGAGTLRLAERQPGDPTMDIVGPLGHGWDLSSAGSHALLVTGGLGAAPMGMLAEKLAVRGVAVVVAMGAPTADRLVGKALFDRLARRVEVATDDGSAGDAGFVTGISERLMVAERFDCVYTCGPEIMQQKVCAQAAMRGIPCQVSLERLMACGVGACLSCVVMTTSGQRRACVDGPVFSAGEVAWDASETPPKH